MLFTVLNKWENKQVSKICFSSSLSEAYIDNPFKHSAVSQPFSWMEQGIKQCALMWHCGTDGDSCMAPDVTPERSLGQQEQWQNRTTRAEAFTDCLAALTAFHMCIGKTRSTLFLKENFPLYIHSKSYSTLPCGVTHKKWDIHNRLGVRIFVYIASPTAALLEDKAFCLFLMSM